MNKFLDAIKTENNFTYTENGAVALKSTMDDVLDAFSTLGTFVKNCDGNEDKILRTFYKAFAEDKALAMRLLFYLRDVRGGQGCRQLFRIIMRSLAELHPAFVVNNLENFLFYGRGDDLVCLLDTSVESAMFDYVNDVLAEDLASVRNGGSCSLLAKWLPSENASSVATVIDAKRFIKGLGLTPKAYRKRLSELRKAINIVETLMSQNKWDEIEFDKLPSRASMIYADAFEKHVKDNYYDYLMKLATGDSKVNAGALYPYDIIHKIREKANASTWCFTPTERIKRKDVLLLDAMWKALPNYFEEAGKEETGLCVIDTSGSMLGTPIEVAVSLGIYCADKAKGPFKNHFITFSANPELQEIKGDTIVEKYHNLEHAHWGMNTDLVAVFKLILDTAIRNNLTNEEIPDKLYIISDMQFDQATSSRIKSTLISRIRKEFEDAGYTFPAIVYWNVDTRDCGMFQETKSGMNCCMVSGYSSSLFKSVILGTEYEEVIVNGKKVTKTKLDPMTVMLNTLNNERYDRVWGGE